MIEIAKNLFFFTKSERVNIYVKDGFDYIMNLKKTQSYDLIILDAFAKG
jgi:spermidine synthase